MEHNVNFIRANIAKIESMNPVSASENSKINSKLWLWLKGNLLVTLGSSSGSEENICFEHRIPVSEYCVGCLVL